MIKCLAHCEAYIDFEADEISDPRLSQTFVEVTKDVEEMSEYIEGLI